MLYPTVAGDAVPVYIKSLRSQVMLYPTVADNAVPVSISLKYALKKFTKSMAHCTLPLLVD